MSNPGVKSNLPCGGVVDFLRRQDLLPSEPDGGSGGSSSGGVVRGGATRSMSAVVIRMEGGTKPSHQACRWNQSPPVGTPMSELLGSSRQRKCTSFDGADDDGAGIGSDARSGEKRVGPEQFLEMLRRKTTADLSPVGHRRRTVSENHESFFRKFSKPSRPRLSDLHRSYNSPPMTRSVRVQNFAEGKLRNSFCEDSMVNFPKISIGSPTSPLKEFCQFASSPSEPVVIWKEPNEEDRIIKVLSATEDDGIERVTTTMSLERMIENVLKMHTAYDAMQLNSKCIILDLNLKVGSAFDALTYDGIHAAPLWDDRSRSFVGMLTMTDFIRILQQYLDQPEVLSTVKDDPVSKWRDRILLTGGDFHFPSNDCLVMPVDSKLGEVLTQLLTNQIHRVVIVDPVTENALFVATYRQVLKYLWCTLPMFSKCNARVLNRTLQELNLGSYENLVSVSLETPVSEILLILLSRRLSSIPVVDEDFRVIDLFRKADIMSLILNGSFEDLSYPVRDVLSYERNGYEGLYGCRRSDVAYEVISSMVVLGLHRVVVLDDDGRLEGIVSLSDVVRFLIDPEKMDLDC